MAQRAMIDQQEFREFIDRRFDQDEPVIVHSLGPNMPGEFEATVKGIHACEPFEHYIIEWKHPEEIEKFYRPGKTWTHCVLSKACLRKI